ncbi:uncharacterized protein LAJ45_09438 [Morchella importuna]|uniref:uncharacterized protein n=1 Tax=Morchella importuna TaxID=1174673 RepID=UPI001E8EBBAA|nr:uncharacterized protein LAJ45_09438 [Morchella importuna]KAH8146492.1 hypothetical protein LAJ45_09438 [Morchella importuna]
MVTYLTTGLPSLLPARLLRPDPPSIRPPRATTGTRTPTAPTAAAELILQPVEISIPRPPPPPPPSERTGWWGCVLRWLRLYRRGGRIVETRRCGGGGGWRRGRRRRGDRLDWSVGGFCRGGRWGRVEEEGGEEEGGEEEVMFRFVYVG